MIKSLIKLLCCSENSKGNLEPQQRRQEIQDARGKYAVLREQQIRKEEEVESAMLLLSAFAGQLYIPSYNSSRGVKNETEADRASRIVGCRPKPFCSL